MSRPARNALRGARLVFWDFDGVIKDSVEVKTEAFVRLFKPFGTDVALRVREHHEANGGLSRYEKIPIYLGWASQPVTPEVVRQYCDRFADSVTQAVIDSAWVPGVQEYLRAHSADQPFVLVTATPQEEIERILTALSLTDCFREIHGAPTAKSAAVRDALRRFECPGTQAVVVGDSDADFRAAEVNSVPFVMRRTPLNRALQLVHAGSSFDGLDDE